jgi:hypothetical protein
MQLADKKYLNGFVNADDEANSLAAGEVLRAVNLRFGSTDAGATGRWEPIPSNVAITNPYLPTTGTNITLQTVSEDASQYIVYFNYNSLGSHGIYLYYKPTNNFYIVLAGSAQYLNFDKDRLIQARIANGALYWTDNLDKPRMVVLGAAIKMNHSSFSPIPCPWAMDATNFVSEDLLHVRIPYPLSPVISKGYDPLASVNRIDKESFQFAVRYIYWNGEKSVLSPWSKSSFLNSKTDNYNFISVSIPSVVKIPQGVRIVQFVALFASTKKAFVVQSFDKTTPEGSGPIDVHNTLNLGLSFVFTNSALEEGLDNIETNTPFHSVPLRAKAIEAAKNRIFYGNLLEGYDTPGVTSLTVSSVAQSAVGNEVHWIDVSYYENDTTDPQSGDYTMSDVVVVKLDNASPAGYYYLKNSKQSLAHGSDFPDQNLDFPGASPSQTNYILASDFTYCGPSIDDVLRVTKLQNDDWITGFKGQVVSSGFITIQDLPGGTTNPNTQQFKSGGEYQFGVVFYDESLNKCGVVTNASTKLSIDNRDYNLTKRTPLLNWSLPATPQPGEIPAWARYYSVVRTMNLKTRFFLQSLEGDVRYFKKKPDGTWDSALTTWDGDVQGVGISTKTLVQAGLGYTFSEGDICRLQSADNTKAPIELPVIGMNGDYIMLKQQNIDSLNGVYFAFEIYTPYVPEGAEPFYETGEMYQIVSGKYSVNGGTITGDTFAVTRKRQSDNATYAVEAMSPNDDYWQRWDTDAGRINIVTKLGQVWLKTGVRFSDTFIDGTQTNGLSSFQALNSEVLPPEMGEIQKLVLTSKVQGEGTVMLCLGTSQTASVYIGETQVTNEDTTSYFVKSNNVIAQVNILKGDFGTLNPESVVSFKGDVWWYDALSGRFVQYSVNGLDDISEGAQGIFKFSRISKALAQKYLSLSASDIEAMGSRPFIVGGIDPHHKEVYWTFPKMAQSGAKGELQDFPGTFYPYDILDYQAKTLVYKIGKRWMGEFSFTPELMADLGSGFYSFKNGILYRHGASGFNTFYGQTYKSSIAFVCNKDNTVKEFLSLALEGSTPDWVHLRTEVPYEQSTDLTTQDFTLQEGVCYAPILRDRLTPDATSFVMGQISGDKIRSKAMLIFLQWSQIDYFRTATIGYNQSSGHY